MTKDRTPAVSAGHDGAGAPGAHAGDAATELAFRRSLRAARTRRAAAAATRRWSLRRRATAVLATVAATGLAGAAVAQQPASSGASPAGATSLKAGAHGAGVQALQRKLGLPADGVYGTRTRRAVRRFQRAHGLQVDGVAGPATLRALGLGRVRAAAPATGAGAASAVARDASAGSGRLERIARCESGGDPDGRLGERAVPREVPVRPRHLARARRPRRSGPRLRGRAGPPRRGAARTAGHRALAHLRVGPTPSARGWTARA